MKFLCVPCDSPMKLQTVGPPEGGSLSVVYSCPECGYEMAMLTNPFETQLVQSLGVRIGPERRRAVEPPSRRRRPGGLRRSVGGGGHLRQPLPVHRDDSRRPTRLGLTRPSSLSGSAGLPPRKPVSRTFPSSSARWRGPASRDSPGSRGALEVDETILDAARDFFGM